MPYKKEYYAITCPKCGNSYTVLTQAWKRKQKDPIYGMLCKSCRSKVQHEEMSEEQKKEMSRKAQEAIKIKRENMTEEEKRLYKEKRSKISKSFWNNMTSEERENHIKNMEQKAEEGKSKMSQHDLEKMYRNISIGKKKAFESMSPEERQEWSDKKSKDAKRYWDSMSDEEKHQRLNLLFKGSRDYWSSISQEEKEFHIKRMQNGRDKYLNNLSPEELSNLAKNASNAALKKWNSLTNKERDEIINRRVEKLLIYWKDEENRKRQSQLGIERWNNKTPEEQRKLIKSLNNGWSDWYLSLSQNERNEIMDSLNNKAKEFWENITDEERKRLSEEARIRGKENWQKKTPEEKAENNRMLHESFMNWWNNLSDEDKQKYSDNMREKIIKYWNRPNSRIEQSEYTRKRWESYPSDIRMKITKKHCSSSNGNNNFHKRFEKQFSEYYLSKSFNLIAEYPTTNHGVIHCWDYAIFRDTKLCMLIDLDGAYFHADICDYDGIHSKLEYDEKRGRSIPDGIHSCIITEKNFGKCFDYMRSILPLSYEEFIDKRFNEYHSMPFPYPEYTNSELLKSYNDLSKLNCNDKYHQDISLTTRVGDRIMQHFHRSMYNNIIDVWNNDETLRDMITSGYLYHSYLNKNKILQGFNIYEPAQRVSILSAGKAKMIIHRYLNEYDEVFDTCYNYAGIMLACIAMNKRYIGLCNDEIQQRECNNMLSFLKDNGINFNVSFNNDGSEYQCLFAEVSNDNQIDEYLTTYKCKQYVFVVNETSKYKDNIVDVISNKSHFRPTKEYLIIM